MGLTPSTTHLAVLGSSSLVLPQDYNQSIGTVRWTADTSTTGLGTCTLNYRYVNYWSGDILGIDVRWGPTGRPTTIAQGWDEVLGISRTLSYRNVNYYGSRPDLVARNIAGT